MAGHTGKPTLFNKYSEIFFLLSLTPRIALNIITIFMIVWSPAGFWVFGFPKT